MINKNCQPVLLRVQNALILAIFSRRTVMLFSHDTTILQDNLKCRLQEDI